ncbi:MAG: SDR family NAD(P)-dependent oxidoreductase, partial [Candidatus Aminicenantes bacterium]|nr:SDR family NAD(P)-dependent oxidoreductase [Candidatus Aminicenantes bacterium]NIM77524.1 SDR family NAD(P)-dependent oxidoreductase [Candidatus Aminicenantes bacterium]NIN16840.1 SDR family NAD(P)-dependent oxidoreductase [Candidatus Aminicenantes bacterium]NIN40718.1 SDR family NAD(P)-dependent oxidoreductase [Candidatus Aminicenantes bacterium]NIN83527.1 SDR family NAD(P)-dependent oxidoreductase [Candidatus Aminicenantes bacterium]
MIDDRSENTRTGLEIAVIGMAGRFPGAKNIDEFWDNLKNGRESIRFFQDKELEEAGIDGAQLKDLNYVKAKGFLEDVDCFDAAFFGYTPKEAEMTDPQVRLLHECCWEALENAGYEPGSYQGLIGLYTGAASGFYWEILSFLRGKDRAAEEQFAALTLKDKDFSSMRISYRLDLKGPSYTIYTACSTSLVAVDAACRGLLTGQCDMVLAGGVSVYWPRKTGYLFQEGMIHSPDGHCRAFDAKAKGTVFAEGVGIVVLKVLEDALRDGDCIHAVIKGSAVNNDGIEKVGFTAPGTRGQVAVIREALDMARVSAETIGYVETHGTGTSLGDPIEINALKQAFNTEKRGFCGIGSVKTNVGHLDAAAGAAGFIKTVLALKHRQIPPGLHFENPNPTIDFENSPFYVVTTLSPWKTAKYPRRAGVSSFGFGGTNAHVILEEGPEVRRSDGQTAEPPQLILLSARTETALERMTENLGNYLKENHGFKLADAAYTLQVGRKAFKYRRMLAAGDIDEALSLLTGAGANGVYTHAAGEDKRPVVFMFSGQGSQYVNMGRGLYQTEPVFREEMDHCFEILNSLMAYDLKEIIYPNDFSVSSVSSVAKNINQTEIAQSLLFILEYALARMLMKWGIRPYAMIGHSIGEYTAACLSGVFSLEDALRLVVLRGQLMQQMRGGAMLSVPLPEERLLPLLPPGISLAAVNAPSLCVVSGSHEMVDTFAGTLKQNGYKSTPLHTSHAFHSEMMTPVMERFREQVGQVPGHPSGIPFVSNVTGKWITSEQTADPGYWADHLRKTVRFFQGLGELLAEENAVLLEVGPGKGLSTFARQHTRKKPGQLVLNLVRHPQENVPDHYFLLKQTGQLWLHGISIDWQEYHSHRKLFRIPMPTYPFARQRFPDETRILPEHLKEDLFILPGGSSPGKRKPMDQWFYIPTWKQSPLTGPVYTPGETPIQSGWLVFMDACGIGSQLVKQLGKNIVIVRAGETFARVGNGDYTVNPGEEKDFAVLLDELSTLNTLPRGIVYLWGITPNTDLETVFYGLLYLVKAIGASQVRGEIRLKVVTDNMQSVTGEEMICPVKAVLTGACKVIRLEYTNITCQCIDIACSRAGEKLIRQLAAEIVSQTAEPVVALRGPYRWVQGFEPVRLDKPDQVPSRLREKGVYLITGGLGGIGLVLAENLAKTVGARLILTGRGFFPAEEDWETWLSAHDKDDPFAAKIRKIQEIEKSGGEVMVIRADVGYREQMEAAVSQARARFGRIHGVIHAAGIPDGKLIQGRTRELSEHVLAPKVKGTLVLDRIFKDDSLDFFILCSSLNAVLGAVGQVAYCAANAFLDAFALQKNASQQTLFVSINWDVWQEVGMAVEFAKKIAGSAPDVKHPLLNRRLEGGLGYETYISYLSASRHWVLQDHIVMGKPTLPGTACLEMARAAFENLLGQQKAEIRDVVFLTPMALEPGEERETRTILKKQEGFYEFFILSSPEPEKDQWMVHARGKISVIHGDDGISEEYNIREIKAGCGEEEKTVNKDEYESAPGFLKLGPRWYNVKTITFGVHEGMALLELDETFASDLDTHMMHPALLDNATAFMSGKVKESGAYLPISYKKLKVKGPLPRRFFSYSRYKPGVSPGKQTLEFDLCLMDESGIERISIAGYTLMAVSPDRGEAPVPFISIESITGSPLAEQSIKRFYGGPGVAAGGKEEEGILSSQGVEAFARILTGSLPQVLVSTKDLNWRMEEMKKNRAAAAADSIKKAAGGGPIYPRPELTTTYVPPQNERQEVLADILQEFLGIEKVGIHDDFFELGGDSLKALTIVSEIHKRLSIEIPLAEIFNSPTVEKLFQYTENAGESVFSGMKPAEEKEYYILSSAQKRLFILDRLEPGSTGYNLSDAVLIEGELETERVQVIFRELAARHESLRTSFHMVEDEPVQVVHKQVELELEYYEAGFGGGRDPGDGLKVEGIIKNFIRPFELDKAPLVRAGLIKLREHSQVLIVDMHHIITDGTSYNIFESEFMMQYRGEPLPGLTFRYRDYAEWQVSRERKDRLRKDEEFWIREFSEEVRPVNLPLDYSRPAVQSFEGRHVNFKIGEQQTQNIKAAALKHDVTVYMVLLGAYNVLLYKLANQENIVVGTPVAGRNYTDLQQIIGMFINTLALKTFPREEKPFDEFLKEVKETTLKAFEHQDYPFEDLVEKVKVKRDISRNPLFDVMFVFYNMDSPRVDMPGLKLMPYEYEDNVSKFDQTLQGVESGGSLSFTFEYGTNLFKEDTIQRFIRYFKKIVSCTAGDPGQKIGHIDMITEEEKKQVLVEFNLPLTAYPREKTIHRLFEEQVERRPDGVAVVGKGHGCMDAWMHGNIS